MKSKITTLVTQDPQKVPKDFRPEYHACGCLIEHKNKILVVKKTYQSLWGLPGGMIINQHLLKSLTSIEEVELIKQNSRREVSEEITVILNYQRIQFWGTLYIRTAKYEDPTCAHDYCYHICKYKMNTEETKSCTSSLLEVNEIQWWTLEEIEEKTNFMLPAYYQSIMEAKKNQSAID